MANSMFSKRHYEAIAEVLREVQEDFQEVEIGLGVFSALRDRFADLFEADNPRFNREKFAEACRR